MQLNERRYDLGICLSTANLLLLTIWAEVLFTKEKDYFYMLGAPAWPDYLAPVVLELLLGFALFAALRLIRRSGIRWVLTGSQLVFVALLLIPLNTIRFHLPMELGYDFIFARIRKHHLEIPVIISGVILCAAVFVFWNRFVRIVSAAVLILLPFAAMTTAQALAKAVAALDDDPILARIESKQGMPKGPKLVWILFDEFDESMLFSRRPEGLVLPSFDAFQKNALHVTHAVSPANLTLASVPALLTGIPMADAFAAGPSELLVLPRGASQPAPFSTFPDIFTRAKREGFQTTAVGWSLPYCRLFSKSLDCCSWQPVYQTFTGQVPSDEKNLPRAVFDQLAAISPFNRRRLAIHAYREILDGAQKAVVSSSGLLFLHFPIPHEPCIFDREREEFTTTARSHIRGYLDNLVLADRTFGQLRALMESNGEWDRSTIILSSDHVWRDSAAYDGRQSRYVPFLVKMPAQKDNISMDTNFETIHTGEMALKILEGEIGDPAALTRWIEAKGN